MYIIEGPDSNYKFFELFRLYADIQEEILVQLAIGNLYPELISLISIAQTLQNPTLGTVKFAVDENGCKISVDVNFLTICSRPFFLTKFFSCSISS